MANSEAHKQEAARKRAPNASPVTPKVVRRRGRSSARCDPEAEAEAEAEDEPEAEAEGRTRRRRPKPMLGGWFVIRPVATRSAQPANETAAPVLVPQSPSLDSRCCWDDVVGGHGEPCALSSLWS